MSPLLTPPQLTPLPLCAKLLSSPRRHYCRYVEDMERKRDAEEIGFRKYR